MGAEGSRRSRCFFASQCLPTEGAAVQALNGGISTADVASIFALLQN